MCRCLSVDSSLAARTYTIRIQKSQSLQSVILNLKNFGDGSQEQSVCCQQALLCCLSLNYFCTLVQVIIIDHYYD